MVDSALYAGAIKSLWMDRCTVKVKANEKKSGSAFTEQTENVLFSDVPCRLSYKSITVTDEQSRAARTKQATVLILDRSLKIPPGSEIEVTHEGVTAVYQCSGVPAPYSVHQEVPIELKGTWA